MEENIFACRILTRRLILRTIEEKDLKDICEYGMDEQTGKYMIYWPKTEEEIKRFIHDCKDALTAANPYWVEFVLQLASANKVIGSVSLLMKNGAAEVGWMSNKQYWNRGYMSEAVEAVFAYAFQKLNVQKVTATCWDQNIASIRVMEKCGMKRISEEKDCRFNKKGKEIIYTKLTYCMHSQLIYN